MQLKGIDGTGKKLSEDETMGAVKIFIGSRNRVSDLDLLAEQVDFDVEAGAQDAIKIVEPYQMQIFVVLHSDE